VGLNPFWRLPCSTRVSTRQKNKHIARAIVAKEIARIVYHILKEQTDYNHTFKGVTLARPKPLAWPRRASPRT